MSSKLRAWVIDASERVIFTFLAAFIGSLGVDGLIAWGGGHPDMGAIRLAEQAGGAAVIALIKAWAAMYAKNTISPASLAPQQQPGQSLQAAPAPVTAAIRTVVLPERFVPGKPLGRHVHHDERSRAYAVRPIDRSKLVSVRHERLVPVFDQSLPKPLGSCTGNAGAGVLSTAPFTNHFTESDAVSLYTAATRIDDVPGEYPPDDTGSSGLAIAKIAKERGLCSGYQHCFTLDAVLTALQTSAVMLGVAWLSGFDSPLPGGQMRLSGTVRGGHEIEADEIDVENQRVWITNSWGNWGVAGRAWWSWDDLARILANQGDATVLLP